MDEKERILIVDDDEETRRTLRLIYKEKGYEIETAGTGREALERAQERFFNLALLDIKLPDTEGIELITPLREMYPDMLIIMITAYASTETAVRALNKGASAYVIKPLNIDEVLATIREALEKQRLAREKQQIDKALQESEEKYRTLTDNVNVGVYRNTAGPRGKFIEANPAIVKMFGYENKEELFAMNISDLYQNPDDRKKFNEKMLREGFVKDEELKLKKKDGSSFIGSVAAVAVKGNEGKVKYYDGIIEDITERKQIEEQIQNSLKEKETLLKEIHHRVKNNLQIISSLLNLQVEYLKDKRHTEMIKESQDRIKSIALIHEKLYQSEDLAKVDFNEYIKKLIDGLYRSYGVDVNRIVPKIEVKDIFLGIDVAIPCGLIINELVSNSLKHAFPTPAAARVDKTGDKRGEIRISFYSDKDPSTEASARIDNKFTLIISDNGVGLPKDVSLQNIESLGLQLVATLTDQLGGTIELNRNEGTEFIINFSELKNKEGS